MNRRSRYVAALVATAALLFAPLAVSLHACPLEGMAIQAQAQGTDLPPDASLCVRHCDDTGKAPVDVVKPVPGFQLAILPALRVAPAVVPEPALSAWRRDSFLADPSPPLTRFTVLRI